MIDEAANEYAFEYRYPFPVADLYRRYRVSRSPVDKLGYALACAEAALKFTASLTIGITYDYLVNSGSLAALRPIMRSPTLGSWERLLREVAEPIDRLS